MTKYKLAVLTSHPIQYQAPLFRELAARPEIDLTVYFSWEAARVNKVLDREFGQEVKWDIPILEGYKYKFLNNWSPRPSSEFWGQINPGIIREIYDLRFKKLRYSDVPIRQDFRILIFGWNSFTNWLAFLTAFMLKIPVFLRGENPLNQELLKPQWKIKIKKIILGWLFRRIHAFLYIGEENKKFYKYYGVPESKLFFCPYAVDNNRFIAAGRALITKRESLRKELGIKEKDVVVLFAGKLIDKKRPMDLLRAYELLTTNYQLLIAHLIYVGDGHWRPELGKYAKEHNISNVHFLGFKNQTEMPSYYTLADILVLPSGVGETWGLTVNEAMCFGLPIIASDLVGCAPDLVRPDKNGFIFPLGDIPKLALCLSELVNNSSRRKSFGKKSFEIIQNYNFMKNIEGILTALRG